MDADDIRAHLAQETPQLPRTRKVGERILALDVLQMAPAPGGRARRHGPSARRDHMVFPTLCDKHAIHLDDAAFDAALFERRD